MCSRGREGDTELQNLISGGKRKKGCCCNHPYACGSTLCLLIAVCSAVVILGSVFQPKVNEKITDTIADQVKLVPGSLATKEFITPSVPLYATYYFFNITNPQEVMEAGAKPNVVQVGPYVFRENRTCFNLVWLENETVLRYDTNITYTWEKNMSKGNNPNKDSITTVNVPLIGVFQTVEALDNSLVDLLFKAVDELKRISKWDGLLIKRTISELIWGYNDTLLEKIEDIHNLIKYFPGLDPVFSFSNISTVETPNRVHTGVGNISLVSTYIEWNGNTSMSAWGNPYASMINGTGGYSFHPGVTRDEKLEAFIDEVFRSGYFTYNSDIVEHGVKLYKYTLPDDELLNTTQAEAGFPSDNPSGVLSLTPVIPHHIPLYASKPHFLHADPIFRNNVTGLHPDPSLHDSFVGVEPLTGAVMVAAKRIQLSIKLDRSDRFPELKNIGDSTMIPIYYVDQGAEISSSLANQFISTVYTVQYGIMGSLWAVVGLAGLVGVVCFMCLVGLIVQQCSKDKDSSSYRRFREYSSTNADV